MLIRDYWRKIARAAWGVENFASIHQYTRIAIKWDILLVHNDLANIKLKQKSPIVWRLRDWVVISFLYMQF